MSKYLELVMQGKRTYYAFLFFFFWGVWGVGAAFSQVKVSQVCLVVNFTKIMFLFAGVSLKEGL